MSVCMSVCVTAYMWSSEDNLHGSVLSYYVNLGDQIQVAGLGGKCLYLLSHLTDSLRGSVPNHR